MVSKENFLKCLNKYEWSDSIPALEALKNNIKLRENEENKSIE